MFNLFLLCLKYNISCPPTCIICSRCCDGLRIDPLGLLLFSPPQHLSLTVAVDTSSELIDRNDALSDGWWPLWILMPLESRTLLFIRRLLPRGSGFCSGCCWQLLPAGLFRSSLHWWLDWVSCETHVPLIVGRSKHGYEYMRLNNDIFLVKFRIKNKWIGIVKSFFNH